MKTAFITGATAGIGAAAARKFIAEGWQVVGTGRRSERLGELKDELGDRFLGIVSDMRDVDDLQRVVGELPECFQGIDLLLNNAGLAPPMNDLQDADQAPLSNVIDTNVQGLVALTRALLPRLIERKGAVINLSSVAATYPYRGGAIYAGTKAFVRQFSLGLRCDLQGTGVRVTSIEPGMVETEFTLVRTGGNQAASDALYANMNPMTAEDIASTIWWVASLPPHLNINALELMPVSQSWAGFAVSRSEG
ncbi:SDR family NAD(P)-dependent oxidoreductase [Sphingomonas sp. HDW15A]|uniref:SDR family NAD(P)-dependent oxidoreductase n=1 Tax=Sphingomonas sp. HDW15A TaxID=2714942 RepID=UPI00140CA5BC|nr:SDR family NAD(P)-dependent oxidoreductase [Sphingomonas sp. HDW15A]QIK97034.1 SDR family NAD(P)-dependent oxidoreductase [Sphingomonas sp. HDW15A]